MTNRAAANNDPQRQDEISRQRAYGERPGAESPEQVEPGFRRGEAGANATPDRGVFRDDGQPLPANDGKVTTDRDRDLVISPEDDRTNNLPETAGADHGEMRNEQTGDDADKDGSLVSRERLKDAYGRDDGSLKTD